MNDNKKSIEELRAERVMGTQFSEEELRVQLKENHEKRCNDYKKYLEANGYRVVKL